MKNTTPISIVLMSLCFVSLALTGKAATVLVHQESFEAPESPSTYTLTGAFNDGANDYFGRIDDSSGGFFPNPNNEDGQFYIAGEDMDVAEGIPGGIGEITFAQIDVSSHTDIQLVLGVANAVGSILEANDFIKIFVSQNGGPSSLMGAFYGNGASTNLHQDTNLDGTGDTPIGNDSNFHDFTFNLTATSTLDIRIEMAADGSGEEIAIDNLRVTAAPEPSSCLSLLFSVVALCFHRRRAA